MTIPNSATVSAVITAYNRPDFLEKSLASVLAQTYPLSQIIIVDDCSPTSLIHLLEKIKDPRIEYVRLEENSGANVARNIGIQKSTSEWVAFLDDDDAWYPEKIDKQMHIVKSRFIACVTSYSDMYSKQNAATFNESIVSQQRLKNGNPYCGTSGLIVKRSILIENPFDEDLPSGQDWDMYVRLSHISDIAYIPEPLLYFRRGSHESITTKSAAMSWRDKRKRAASATKHKEWLGHDAYCERVVRTYLSFPGLNFNTLMMLIISVKEVGVKKLLVYSFSRFKIKTGLERLKQ